MRPFMKRGRKWWVSHTAPPIETEMHNRDLFAAFAANRSHDVLAHLYGHYHRDTVKVVDGVGTVGKDIYNSRECMLIDKATRRLTSKRYGLRALDRVY